MGPQKVTFSTVNPFKVTNVQLLHVLGLQEEVLRGTSADTLGTRDLDFNPEPS